MANKYSPEEIVSSIFKKFENQWLTPEFIREESNRVSDALFDFRIGDPGRTSRNFADRNCIQRDNPTKASAYQYSRISCKDETFFSIINVYDVPEFDDDKYKALVHLDSLRTEIAKKPINLESLKTKIKSQQNSSFTPSQVIYYGVPGCGKSNKIKDLLRDVPDERKERVVFHSEYTHADFVGQILPVVHDGVDYKFTPGPFTKMVAKAYKSLASENPEQFYLVIEEINRGNAAAIFGDVFQLLDRIKPGESDSSLGNGSVYTEGWSQYFVYNEDVNSKVLELAEAAELEMGSVTITKDSGIRLPPNLSILATMNTSDQNVSTLDNAFQRRFDMELVRNEFEKDESGEFKTAAIKAQHDAVIEGANCTWGDFWENINKKIIQYNRGLASTEDKRLGPWFVCSVAGETGDGPRKIPAKTFTEKVLKYLWDDAFKFKRSQVFADGLSSLEQVVSAFEKADGEKLKAVFKEF